jgi:hypothetical protein
VATSREQLDTENQSLIDLWGRYFTDIDVDADIFSDNAVYDSSDSMYTTDSQRVSQGGGKTRPTVRTRQGLTSTRVTEMNKVVRLNQGGVGNIVGSNKTIQLFSSYDPYIKNEHRPENRMRSIINRITGEQTFTSGAVQYMIDHWERIAQSAVQQGRGVGKKDNLPGSDHVAPNAAGQTTPNRYKHRGGYRRSYLTNIDNPAEVASAEELSRLGVNKFNEAQVLGGKGWGVGGRNNTQNPGLNFNDTDSFLGKTFDMLFGEQRSGLQIARDELERIRQDIVSHYLPGINRITQPFHARSSLDEYLQQNVLLPSETGRTMRPSVDTGEYVETPTGPRPRVRTVVPEQGTSTFATYRNLYINNPVRPPKDSIALITSAGGDPKRFDKGVISGVAIKDLERQGEAGVLSTAAASTTQPDPIFTYKDHDEARMSNDMKSRGFTQNIAHTVRGPAQGALKPAVENIEDFYQYPPGSNDAGERKKFNAGDKQFVHAGLGNEQYFPFLFTTENKIAGRADGPFQQVCYMQATIDNLNESFTPTWQPKHFFGRTESIQTYTSTQRSIDISFMVHAPDMRSLQNLWERVSWLAQQTYGQYQTTTSPQPRLQNGPLLRMTIGDLYVGLPGYLQSLTYDWNALGPGGKWEMTQGLRIPMACKIQMSYMVMHDDNPDRNYNFYAGMTDGVFGWARPQDAEASRGRLIQSKNDKPGQPANKIHSTYADSLDQNTSIGDPSGFLEANELDVTMRSRMPYDATVEF